MALAALWMVPLFGAHGEARAKLLSATDDPVEVTVDTVDAASKEKEKEEETKATDETIAGTIDDGSGDSALAVGAALALLEEHTGYAASDALAAQLEALADAVAAGEPPVLLAFVNGLPSTKLVVSTTVRDVDTAAVIWQSGFDKASVEDVSLAQLGGTGGAAEHATLFSTSFESAELAAALESPANEWSVRFDCRKAQQISLIEWAFAVYEDAAGDIVVLVADFAHAEPACTGDVVNVLLVDATALQGGAP